MKLKQDEYVVGLAKCPWFIKILKRLDIPGMSKRDHVLLDPKKKYIGKVRKGRKIVSPSIIKLCKSGFSVVANGTHEIEALVSKIRPRNRDRSGFGNVLNSGTYRAPGQSDFLPQPNWGGFSYSPGGNRAGNEQKCDGYNTRINTSTRFPKQNKALSHEQKKNIIALTSFGLPRTMRRSYLDQRGKDGFDKVPESIYSNNGDQVFTRDYSPYGGARKAGIIPRPFGQRDTAMMKGYPVPKHLSVDNNSQFGSNGSNGSAGYGPFINQSYFGSSGSSGSNDDGYGPFINQSYFGLAPYPDDPESGFRPSPGGPTYKEITQKIPNLVNPHIETDFGSEFGSHPGPNTVGYRDQFLQYPGSGGNSLNYLTGKNYYAPCDRPINAPERNMGVRRLNNPTGYLGSAKRMNRTSSVAFGSKPDPDPKALYTTGLFNEGGGGSGYEKIGQPMDLYTYQNTDYGSYTYPKFSGPRMWMGGYGNTTKKTTVKRKSAVKKKPVKRKTTVKKKKPVDAAKKRRKKRAVPGDTLSIKNGRVKVIKKRDNRKDK